jgi:hypothetical protein
VVDVESPEWALDYRSLQNIILSVLGEAVGLRGIVEELHQDLTTFAQGFKTVPKSLGLDDEVCQDYLWCCHLHRGSLPLP